MLFFSFDHAGNGPSDQDVVISMIRNMVPTLHTSSTTGGLSKGPVVQMGYNHGRDKLLFYARLVFLSS
jgi:hypothetical protein